MSIRYIEWVPIDGDKLKYSVIKRGYSLSSISAELGYSHAWLHSACKAGRVRPIIIKIFEKMYNIPYSEYEPEKEEEPDPVVKEPKNIETHIIHDIVNLTDLKHVIYDAVYQAMYDALNDKPTDDKADDKGIKVVPYV